MEGLLNKAEYVIENSQNLIREGVGHHLFESSLNSKLFEVYQQETSKELILKHISFTHKILEKLVKRDKLNCLIVNLYKGNEGYSLAVKTTAGIETETIKLKYEDDCFLTYLDNEELPPMLLDLLDESKIDIYNSGCIIAELRDFRRCFDVNNFESRYVLLKPSNQSIAADVASISRGKNWSAEEKLLLESEIVKRTAPPLNLSPSILVGLVNNKLHQQKCKFSSVPLRKASRRFTQVSQNRVKEFMECKPPKQFRLLHFLQSRNGKRTVPKLAPKQMVNLIPKETETKDCFDLRKQQEELQIFYQRVADDVKKRSKPTEKPPENPDNSLVFIEEYTLETERAQGRIYLTKLTISQQKCDDIFVGELYVDRDYQEGKQNGSTCRFSLGTQDQVDRYIQQFKEILTEEGRKSVKIIHRLAGDVPKLVVTSGSKERKDLDKQEQLILQISEENANLESQMHATGKPVTSVTTVLSGQPQQSVAIGQTMVVGGNLNLANLLSNNRPVIGGDPINSATTNSVSNNKVTVNVQAGSSNTKLALPMLAAQLNRPAPSYSQSIKIQGSTALTESPLKVQAKDTVSTSTSSNSNLQALLAGTPSADNPSPNSKGPTLLERLSAQSIGLNSMKTTKQNGVGEAKILTSSAQCSILRTDGGTVAPANINFANVTSLQGLNVSIPNLAGNLQTLQNVQIVTKTTGAPVASSGATVIIANQSGLQQGQVVQFGQLGSSQLATQLSNPVNQTVTTGSTIPVLQVQGVGNPMFTSIQKAPTSQPSTAQPVQVSIAPTSVTYYKNLKFLDS